MRVPKWPNESFRSLERLCLQQAGLCTLDVSREALEWLAANYRKAAEREEQVLLNAKI